MMTLRTCDFDTYCAIENYVFNILADDEAELLLDDVQAFAARYNVTITADEVQQMVWDFDEM